MPTISLVAVRSSGHIERDDSYGQPRNPLLVFLLDRCVPLNQRVRCARRLLLEALGHLARCFPVQNGPKTFGLDGGDASQPFASVLAVS